MLFVAIVTVISFTLVLFSQPAEWTLGLVNDPIDGHWLSALVLYPTESVEDTRGEEDPYLEYSVVQPARRPLPQRDAKGRFISSKAKPATVPSVVTGGRVGYPRARRVVTLVATALLLAMAGCLSVDADPDPSVDGGVAVTVQPVEPTAHIDPIDAALADTSIAPDAVVQDPSTLPACSPTCDGEELTPWRLNDGTITYYICLPSYRHCK